MTKTDPVVDLFTKTVFTVLTGGLSSKRARPELLK